MIEATTRTAHAGASAFRAADHADQHATARFEMGRASEFQSELDAMTRCPISAAVAVAGGEPFHLDGARAMVHVIFPSAQGAERDVVVIRSLKDVRGAVGSPLRAVTVTGLAQWVTEGRVDPLFGSIACADGGCVEAGDVSPDECAVHSGNLGLGRDLAIHPAW